MSRELTYSEWNVWKILAKVLKRPQRMKNRELFSKSITVQVRSNQGLFCLPYLGSHSPGLGLSVMPIGWGAWLEGCHRTEEHAGTWIYRTIKA